MPDDIPCPRCRAPLALRELADVMGLECTGCLGLFLDAGTVERLASDAGHATRVAFPRRARAHEPEVQYIPCITCARPMNRTVFGKVSGVIVDVCKDHGVWFDAGEINAIIQFVEEGGMARAQAKMAREKAAESKRLADERRTLNREQEIAIRRAYGQHHPDARLGLPGLFDWW